MVTLTINGINYTGQPNETIIQLAQREGIFIPSLCFSEKLPAHGACGLCLIIIGDNPHPKRACAVLCEEGLQIKTDTPHLRNLQRQVLSLILSQHQGNCIAPCQQACPALTPCANYIALINEGKLEEAIVRMYEAHPFPASLAHICPRPCEKKCKRNEGENNEAVNIAGLKRYATSRALVSAIENQPAITAIAPLNYKYVAIVGGGPAGLTAAYFLRKKGHEVTVYERNTQMGGLLRYGIPDFRLPKEVLDNELTVFSKMGINFVTDLHAPLNLPALRGDNHAVILAIGASESKPLGCVGDNLPIVQGGTAFLHLASMGYSFKTQLATGQVIVIGGSNTAIDAARTALRLGAKTVTIVYRRTRHEMPAEPHEIAIAEEEGVLFKFLAAPLEVTTMGIHVQLMALSDPDESGRRAPVPIEGSTEFLPAVAIIAAIGQAVNTDGFDEIPLTRWQTPEVHPHTFETPITGVYAIGDVTGLSAYAIDAIAHGKNAAMAVHAFLSNEPVPPPKEWVANENSKIVTTPATSRMSDDDFIGTDAHEKAKKEAHRCLQCGCGGFYKCKLISLANSLGVRIDNEHQYTAPHNEPQAHNPLKCILCGLCVRACPKDLLSFAFRSNRTLLATQLLKTSFCENCIICKDACPTGAMQYIG